VTPGESITSLATSRYQAADLIGASGLVPVRITLGSPRWKLPYALVGSIKALAPTRDLFARRGSTHFESDYVAQLDGHGVEVLSSAVDALSRQHGGRGLVLLCFEDVRVLGESSCHRRMFARWWEARTDQRVPEL
jgi:hypothetical protein